MLSTREKHVNDVASWSQAYTRAQALTANGRQREAVYYFINAIGRAPGELELIRSFAQATVAMASQAAEAGDRTEAVRQLDWLEAFLKERVAFVEVPAIPDILQMASYARDRRDFILSGTPRPEGPARFAEIWQTLTQGSVHPIEGRSTAELSAHADTLAEVRDYVVGVQGVAESDPTLAHLEREITKLRTAVEFDRLVAEAERLVSLANAQTTPTAAAYCLQGCEGIARQAVVMVTSLDAGRKATVDRMLGALKTTSEAISAKSREVESEVHWSKFEAAFAPEMQSARDWKAPEVAEPNKYCQQQLDRLQKLTRTVQGALPKLTAERRAHQAMGLLDELRELATSASKQQQRAYNVWAMYQIQSGYRAGLACLSVINDDEIKLGQRITEHFGPIDPRFLTAEVHRCHTEVFEFLFKELDGPKSEMDFNTRGRKLKVLKDLFETEKRSLDDF
jgi:hypothetical protein